MNAPMFRITARKGLSYEVTNRSVSPTAALWLAATSKSAPLKEGLRMAVAKGDEIQVDGIVRDGKSCPLTVTVIEAEPGNVFLRATSGSCKKELKPEAGSQSIPIDGICAVKVVSFADDYLTLKVPVVSFSVRSYRSTVLREYEQNIATASIVVTSGRAYAVSYGNHNAVVTVQDIGHGTGSNTNIRVTSLRDGKAVPGLSVRIFEDVLLEARVNMRIARSKLPRPAEFSGRLLQEQGTGAFEVTNL